MMNIYEHLNPKKSGIEGKGQTDMGPDAMISRKKQGQNPEWSTEEEMETDENNMASDEQEQELFNKRMRPDNTSH